MLVISLDTGSATKSFSKPYRCLFFIVGGLAGRAAWANWPGRHTCLESLADELCLSSLTGWLPDPLLGAQSPHSVPVVAAASRPANSCYSSLLWQAPWSPCSSPFMVPAPVSALFLDSSFGFPRGSVFWPCLALVLGFNLCIIPGTW